MGVADRDVGTEIAYLTRALRLQAGVVISASHNPYYDNGIKFFSASGTKLPDAVELEIEAHLDQLVDVAGRVDHGALAGAGVSDEPGVDRESGDGASFEEHEVSVAAVRVVASRQRVAAGVR